jgi:hypothetical protein
VAGVFEDGCQRKSYIRAVVNDQYSGQLPHYLHRTSPEDSEPHAANIMAHDIYFHKSIWLL